MVIVEFQTDACYICTHIHRQKSFITAYMCQWIGSALDRIMCSLVCFIVEWSKLSKNSWFASGVGPISHHCNKMFRQCTLSFALFIWPLNMEKLDTNGRHVCDELRKIWLSTYRELTKLAGNLSFMQSKQLPKCSAWQVIVTYVQSNKDGNVPIWRFDIQ